MAKMFVTHDDGKLFQLEYSVCFWVLGDRRNPIGKRRFDTLAAAKRDAAMLRKKYHYGTSIFERHIPVSQ